MLEELVQKIRQRDVRSFEDFYVLTYETLYSYAWILTDAQREKALEVLIRTYCRVYQECENIPAVSDVYEWLYQAMDQVAIQWLKISEDQIRKIKNEEENYETVVKLTEETAASVLLSIEELLGLMEDQEETFDRRKKIMTVVKFAFACLCLGLAVFAVCDGLEKLKDQIDIFNHPFSVSMPSGEDGRDRASVSNVRNEQNRIKVRDKIYYLSDIGQVLYSLPLEDSDWLEKLPYNSEIQESEKWVYYLPCPERADSRLSGVSPQMAHVLYRLKKQDESIEIVSAEVEDYTVFQDRIYLIYCGRIQTLSENDSYEPLEDRMVVEIKDNSFFLTYLLGHPLPTNADQTIQYEDRIYKMRGNRIDSVTAAECVEGNTRWYFQVENARNMPEIYQNKDEEVSVFENRGIQIDSFCKIDQWIYYSATMSKNGEGVIISRIYRKSLDGSTTELIRDNFTGNILNMYYVEADQSIYAEYYPRSWESGYGRIAVITTGGSMSVLADPEIRDNEATTGHDNLSFVFAQGEEIYCFWNNCSWIQGQKPFVIWSKPIVLSGSQRIPVP